jgi:hypothetical protein
MEPLKKSQFVLRVNLTFDGGDPGEQIRRKTCDLNAGTFVRVFVGDLSPIPFAIPILGYADFAWYRPDLSWGFETDNEQRLIDWQRLEAGLRVAIK